MLDSPLKTLRNTMQDMYLAASEGDWDNLEKLDRLRSVILNEMQSNGGSSPIDENMILEIIELDQAILHLTSKELEYIASKVTVDSEKSRICAAYQSHSRQH